MGHHFALASRYGYLRGYFVLGCQFVVAAEDVSSCTELTNLSEEALRDLPLWKEKLMVGTSGKIMPDFDAQSLFQTFASAAGVDPTSPSVLARFGEMYRSPPFQSSTQSPTTIVRYSAFQNDPRVGANGSLTPGTYATSASDAREVPSGLAAVGRYSLPNPRPAIYRFDVTVPAGTTYLYGSVVPAFGRSGGGVEMEFPQGVPGGISLVSTVLQDL
jgi:hypothetical protein